MRWRCLLSLVLSLLRICQTKANAALISSENHKQYQLMESYMDVNANPCTDYYQYACGNWKTVQDNEDYGDTLLKLDYELNEEYESILKTRQKNFSKQNKFVQEVLAYYKSCTSTVEYLPTEYLKKLEIYEGLKLNSTNWLLLWATLGKYGLNSIFISESVTLKEHNSRQYTIELDRPADFEKLERLSFEVAAQEIGMTNKSEIEALWVKVEELETKLADLWNIEDQNDAVELSLSAITVPYIKDYLKILLNATELSHNMKLSLANQPYMLKVFKLLNDFENEIICRYLLIRFIMHMDNDGPADFSSIYCIKNLRDELPLAMSWLHEQQHLELLAEAECVEEIFEKLRTRFAQILKENQNNFDAEVLDFLNNKVKHVQLKVGNLPRNESLKTMLEFHRELSLDENDFYGNHLKILRFLNNRQHALLLHLRPTDSHNFYYLEEPGYGSVTMPYYLQRPNMVMLPLQLLQPPLYQPQTHEIFKFSIIGFLLAHEMTHGFDNIGLNYDGKGNRRESFGELIKANKIFDGHLDCLLAKNTRVIDEKIADVTGLRVAYEAYFGINGAAAVSLPWSKLTPQQLFFRNFALFFCGNIANEDRLVNGTHGTYRSRLYDTISQFDEFGRAFNCQAGAAMHPTRKCQLWR